MSELYLEGELLKVTLEIRLPVVATEEQIEQWLNFELSHSGGMPDTNPLSTHGVETFGSYGLEWESTDQIGREETFDHQELPNGGRSWKSRYVRERIA